MYLFYLTRHQRIINPSIFSRIQDRLSWPSPPKVNFISSNVCTREGECMCKHRNNLWATELLWALQNLPFGNLQRLWLSNNNGFLGSTFSRTRQNWEPSMTEKQRNYCSSHGAVPNLSGGWRFGHRPWIQSGWLPVFHTNNSALLSLLMLSLGSAAGF